MDCPICGETMLKIDESGGVLNRERTPLIDVFQCIPCDQCFEIKRCNGEFLNPFIKSLPF